MDYKKNPIKHVKFSTNDYFKPRVFPGGNSTPHKEVTDEFKIEILKSIDCLRDGLTDESGIPSSGLSAAVVELEEKATAKSNRPTGIFNESTCPFFGDVGYSKFLIQISDSGLAELKARIERVSSKAGTKEISAIKSISKYEPSINADHDSAISVRLFRFSVSEANDFMDRAFESFLESSQCVWTRYDSKVVGLYRVSGNTQGLMQSLSVFSGVQSIISSRCIKIKPMVGSGPDAKPATMLPPVSGVDYPVVAVVDSGISESCDLWCSPQKVDTLLMQR